MSGRFSLAGKVALVTGGASGIGQAIAIGMAEAGADVAVTANRRGADETVAGIEQAGRRALVLPVDLAGLDTSGAEALLDKVAEELGPVNILVNNAGIIRRAPAADYPDEDWQAVMAVNLDAVWRLSRAAGKRMLARKQGSIISIASLLSYQGGVFVPAYAAAKHAVAGLTKALANEWAGQGVNVNAIAPGYIATANTAALQADETRNRQILERIPAGHWGSPEDIAGSAVFLASPAARYVHGHVLTVDGGWMAR
ncbi:2-dehydro-3-deoxy-D-gluconate 5-dehydrogenase KduD [Telmatospirillum sp. J64-1]|uniref:2-dehydro-3-deoxy-D-gluconate 5-dehydrogenase KduD n=1 Tax=Telmatospirillum sp. J64-1 TaxID=2502183 RepID=UPI00115CD67D|nr:2-dehydro-3-deoxy-D-gluconate 5-dehydrogenase KduD [Telmatospirillum sp. J64-1]